MPVPCVSVMQWGWILNRYPDNNCGELPAGLFHIPRVMTSALTFSPPCDHWAWLDHWRWLHLKFILCHALSELAVKSLWLVGLQGLSVGLEGLLIVLAFTAQPRFLTWPLLGLEDMMTSILSYALHFFELVVKIHWTSRSVWLQDHSQVLACGGIPLRNFQVHHGELCWFYPVQKYQRCYLLP